jgi:hypothetical protein
MLLPDDVDLKCFKAGPLAAMVTRDEIADGDLRWHISVQHEDRIPNWNELVEAAHGLRPGVPLAIGIPPRSWWLNIHPRVLHLIEIHDQHLLDQWRSERQGHAVT